MPLGNLTSQFFANIYLNKLDNFIKRKLQIKYYLRYVDDFIIFHNSRKQLKVWKEEINYFLKDKLDLELHPDKSKLFSLHRGADFVGFKNFYFHKLPRKRNIRKMNLKIENYSKNYLSLSDIINSFIGWKGFAEAGNTFKLRRNVLRKIYKIKFQN